MGRREEQRQATRQAIIDAALELFEQRGIHRVTVDEIAAHAGVGRTTFFRHFRSKHDVLFGHHATHMQELDAALRRHPDAARSPQELRRAFLEVALTLESSRDQLARFAEPLYRDDELNVQALRQRTLWEALVTDVLTEQAGLDEPTMRIRVLAVASVGALQIAVRQWRLSSRQGDFVPLLEQALDLVGLNSRHG
jgi:AcrR family transcriptional regulator